MIWVITDTHWNHENIIKYEHRPKNFNELIIENWCNLVGADDLVIHLGDVIFKRAGELKNLLASLPGKKILTMGNHDTYHGTTAKWFRKRGFDHVFRNWFYLQEYKIIFSHIPVDIKRFPKHLVQLNIHGHFHRQERTDEGRTSDSYPFYSKDTHILLSLEEENYKPVGLNNIICHHQKSEK